MLLLRDLCLGVVIKASDVPVGLILCKQGQGMIQAG